MSQSNGSLGSLAKKFPHLAPDDDLLQIIAWCESLETEVRDFNNRLDVWTQAILAQTALSKDQNQLITDLGLSLAATATTNDALGQTLLQLKQEFKQLGQQFTALKSAIAAHGSILQRFKDSIGILEQKLINLELQLDLLPKAQDIRDLTIEIRVLKGNSKNFWSSFFLVSLGVALTLVFVVGWVQGSSAGRSAMAAQFEGAGNLDFWKQVREQNKGKITECKNRGQATCSLKLP